VHGQSGGYVVRGQAKVLAGDKVVVQGVTVTLSGVELAKGYATKAKRALQKRIGNSDVGCMVDGSWSGRNWGYCGDPKKPRSRDVKQTLNAWLVRTGNALSDDGWGLFSSEEAAARGKGKGVWKK
jgi:endonuclease YncB( thermonuclease family)